MSWSTRVYVPILVCLVCSFAAPLSAGEAKGSVSLASPVPVGYQRGEIPADERDAFQAWVDERIALWIKAQAKGKSLPPGMKEHELFVELQAAGVDPHSFLIRGDKNHEFPKMLFYNDFLKKPLYYAHPKHLVRQITHYLPEAKNVEHDGGIPHSGFFTNTVIETYTPEFLAAEIGSFLPQGCMEVTKVKSGGTSEGIWVKDERGRKYILIFDPPFSPEMTTSAEFIGSTLLRIAGFHVPKTCVCHVNGTGDALYDGRRVVATIALDDFKGGWKYAEFRDRREIRALQLFGAWIGNVDQTEQNTGVTISDAGVHRHYVLDFGSSLGSFTFRPQMARLGWTRMFDAYQQFTQPLYDRGLRKVPWQAPYCVHSVSIGYFTENFDPDRWQPFYTNMGFVEITEADRVWAAKRIARISDDQIATVVGLAGYTHASDAEHILRTLIARRDIIIQRYLGDGTR